jgi:hypothetical protein
MPEIAGSALSRHSSAVDARSEINWGDHDRQDHEADDGNRAARGDGVLADVVRGRTDRGGPQPSQDGRRCFVATGTHHARTLLGNTFFRFSHTAHWCSDGQNVIGVHYRDQRFTDVSSFAVVEEITEDFVSPTPAREVTTVMKARVDDCLTRLGCLWSLYPYVRLTLRADGTWFATTGESEGTPA